MRRLLLKENSLDSYPSPNTDYSFIGYQGITFSEKLSNETLPIFNDRTPPLLEVLNNGNIVGDKSIDFTAATSMPDIFPSIYVNRQTGEFPNLYSVTNEIRYLWPDSEVSNPANPSTGAIFGFQRLEINGIEFGAIERTKVASISEPFSEGGLEFIANYTRISSVGNERIVVQMYSVIDIPDVGSTQNRVNQFFRIDINGNELFKIDYSYSSNKLAISLLAPIYNNDQVAISAGLTAGNLYIEASTGAIKNII